jgi:hypothetical protein
VFEKRLAFRSIADLAKMRRREVSMIELTREQQRELEAAELVVPTNTSYVLVRQDLYQRIQGLLQDQDWNADAYQAATEVFARDGWDDPRMDVYDELDPRRNS